MGRFGARLHVLDGQRDDDTPWDWTGGGDGRADIVLTGPSPAWRDAPRVLPPSWQAASGGGPSWVHTVSAGVDGFPSWLLRDRLVTCGRGDSAAPIAEYVLGAILVRAKRLDTLRPACAQSWLEGAALVKDGHPLTSPEGQVLGLAGFGAIGRAVAVRARAFGMRVLAWRRGPWTPGDDDGVEPVATLGELAARSDHLVLALPLTADTTGIVGEDVLRRARPGLHLINVVRGDLVDQAALLRALDRGDVNFATLDVTSPEPLADGHPFYTHRSVRLTPHISWSGGAARQNGVRRIVDNIERFLEGRPLRDVVDAARGY
nr:NAD(P)-dependent oxidoreductase [Ameyamaea chiangmaiensis]